MITIFSNPRPFTKSFRRIQLNAVRSWIALGKEVEIILFEDEEETTCKICREFDLICIKDVECNEFGTPLLNSVFEKVKNRASNDIICQINADIILTKSFLNGVRQIKNLMGEKNFFMSGRRWDLNFEGEIDFLDKNWQEKIISKAKKEGNLHNYSGMDYWMFPKKMEFNVPPFVIGRPGMDSWLVFKSLYLGIPVIDATQVISIVHQNHPYPKKTQNSFVIEKERNLKLAGGFMFLMTLREANLLLTEKGLKRPPFPRRIFSILALFYPWRFVFYLKRRLDYLRGIWKT